MSAHAPSLPTVGEISRRLAQPVHRIEYVIRSRRIHAEGRAGSARVFSEAAVNRIAAELRRIDADKEADGYELIVEIHPTQRDRGRESSPLDTAEGAIARHPGSYVPSADPVVEAIR